MKALPLSLLLVCGAALADDQAILACRALPDGGARLACYDAIQVAARSGGAAARTAAAAPAPAPAMAPAPAASHEASFGLEAAKRREREPDAIASTIPGEFQGWGPGAQIRLANGQVWRVIDGSEAVLPRMRDPKVRIERNLFGTLFLRVEGTNNSAKVRRVQ
ncbi:hypothetical protein LE190_06865 [Massilia oculi]|uniref:Uncharacterized protein n=1 Tax=Massilia hydrophila TaxID=3044279 RepID=A0ABS7Y7K8_9BURK|nr:hypothetical protein [Massilia oculi]MCA1855647.1 hypothetical protein [Massilia oculi]